MVQPLLNVLLGFDRGTVPLSIFSSSSTRADNPRFGQKAISLVAKDACWSPGPLHDSWNAFTRILDPTWTMRAGPCVLLRSASTRLWSKRDPLAYVTRSTRRNQLESLAPSVYISIDDRSLATLTWSLRLLPTTFPSLRSNQKRSPPASN
jgi:hypothetical protein